jgi:hypothetical protein
MQALPTSFSMFVFNMGWLAEEIPLHVYSLYYDIIYGVGEARKYLCTCIHCIMILFIVWERLGNTSAHIFTVL